MPPQNQCKVKGVVISDLQKEVWKADVESIRQDLHAVLDVARSVSVQASLKTGILASMSILAHPVMDEFLAQPESGYDKRAKQFCGMPDWNVWVSEISDILAQPDCGLTSPLRPFLATVAVYMVMVVCPRVGNEFLQGETAEQEQQ